MKTAAIIYYLYLVPGSSLISYQSPNMQAICSEWHRTGETARTTMLGSLGKEHGIRCMKQDADLVPIFGYWTFVDVP